VTARSLEISPRLAIVFELAGALEHATAVLCDSTA